MEGRREPALMTGRTISVRFRNQPMLSSSGRWAAFGLAALLPQRILDPILNEAAALANVAREQLVIVRADRDWLGRDDWFRCADRLERGGLSHRERDAE